MTLNLKITYHESEEVSFLNEIELIKLYGRADLGTGTLLNHTDGGEGSSGTKRTPEQNAARKSWMKGRSPGNKGKKWTAEQIKTQSIKMKGKNLGKKHTIEHNLAISAKTKGRLSWNKGLKITPEQSVAQSLRQKGKKRGPYKKKHASV